MVGRGSEFSFSQDIHVRFDIRIDISISVGPMNAEFGKSNETNQAG